MQPPYIFTDWKKWKVKLIMTTMMLITTSHFFEKETRDLDTFIPFRLMEEEHFCLILDFNTFARRWSCDRKKQLNFDPYYCRNCVTLYSNSDQCARHEEQCDIAVGIRFNPRSEKLKFTAKMYSYIGAFDLELLLCKTSLTTSHIEKDYFAYASCFVIIDKFGEVISDFIHCGEDRVDVFICALISEWAKIRKSKTNFPI